ncbi:hypothetical protein BDZ85DRAFT_33069 [Elsinoe ampelina]|uniref:NACHT domain-containing protein n=1 Tax=Elsinoe ampelina TaxID=302913 RepID=A0A6A6G3A4_9PEZI|nr:hypothetical protein BDZ85DRAFT_33069 [Elsinoe ampelina]
MKQLRPEDYQIGWVCPLKVEYLAAKCMLDELHEGFAQPESDHNVYELGEIHKHNVVLCRLSTTGNTITASSVTHMRRTFPNLKFALLVGIGGGVPTITSNGEIRLGHVVVGKPTGSHSGCIQYDSGKAKRGLFERTGYIPAPPRILTNAANKVEEMLEWEGPDALLDNVKLVKKIPNPQARKQFEYPGGYEDRLFPSNVQHVKEQLECEDAGCDLSTYVPRPKTAGSSGAFVLHMGTIATGNAVIKDAYLRDTLSRNDGIICFEMEAAGALTSIECLVVRGISDYCDSHKNDRWQGFASINAAAFAREVLRKLPIDSVKQYQSDLQDLSTHVQELKVSVAIGQRKYESKSILDWLCPSDTSGIHNNALETHHPGTGEWIFNHESYISWITTQGSFLWLSGRLGSGKTTLVSYITNHLACTGNRVVYHYFRHGDASERGAYSDVLRSLCAQLFTLTTKSPASVHEAYSQHAEGIRRPSTITLVKLLDDLLESSEEVFIILDALDETSEDPRHQIDQWISGFIAHRKPRAHLLVTCRDPYEATRAFTHVVDEFETLQMKAKLLLPDLSSLLTTWCEQQLSSRNNDTLWNEENLQLIVEVIQNGPEDMFQWVVSYLKILEKCRTVRELQKELGSVPLDLIQLYRRVLERMTSPREIKLVQLLAAFGKAMSFDEARDALATHCTDQNNRRRFHIDDRLLDADIESMCPALLTVIKDHTSDKRTIRLGHLSIKEFFDRGNAEDLVGFDKATMKGVLVGTCLTYLLDLESTDIAQQNDVDRPFLHWASSNWFEHAADAAASSPEVLIMLEELFTDSPVAYQTWLHFSNPDGVQHPLSHLLDSTQERSNAAESSSQAAGVNTSFRGVTQDPLYLAALAGLTPVIKILMAKEVQFSSPSGWYGSPLVAACARGHKEVVEILLSAGYDVDQKTYYGTPLCAAAANGHLHIVKLLIGKGADPDAVRTVTTFVPAWSPVQPVMTYFPGSYQVNVDKSAVVHRETQKLDDFSRYIPLRTGWRGLPKLSLIEHNMYTGRFKLELSPEDLRNDSGECTLPGIILGTPLCAAAWGGHLSIVKFLLSNSASTSRLTGYFADPLIAAVASGEIDVVRYLITNYGISTSVSAFARCWSSSRHRDGRTWSSFV